MTLDYERIGRLHVLVFDATELSRLDPDTAPNLRCDLLIRNEEYKSPAYPSMSTCIWKHNFVVDLESDLDCPLLRLVDVYPNGKEEEFGEAELDVNQIIDTRIDTQLIIREPSRAQKKKGKKIGLLRVQIGAFRPSDLGRMLAANDARLAVSLCDGKCDDALADGLILQFCMSKRTEEAMISLLRACFRQEVELAESETALFRQTSPATRLMKAVAKHIGSHWLLDTLTPIIHHIMQLPDTEFPDIFEQNDDYIDKLHSQCTKFLYSILNSLAYAPKVMFKITSALAEEVYHRYPSMKLQAAGSFIFLRFFCPAISLPDTVGIRPPLHMPDDINLDKQRAFLLNIAKVLQVLVNNMRFLSNDQGLLGMNRFINGNSAPYLNAMDDWIAARLVSTEHEFDLPDVDFETIFKSLDNLNICIDKMAPLLKKRTSSTPGTSASNPTSPRRERPTRSAPAPPLIMINGAIAPVVVPAVLTEDSMHKLVSFASRYVASKAFSPF